MTGVDRMIYPEHDIPRTDTAVNSISRKQKPAFALRQACPQDWVTIVDFNCRLASETEGKKLVPNIIAAGVQALLAEERHGRYFVACDQSRIIGQMMHTREWSDWRNGEIWWLQSVYVDPDYRRRGVFRSLYQHIVELAQQTAQVVGIRLYVERHNQQAMDTYRSLQMSDAGYSVMERLFVKP